jgi:hypothetical protein
MNSNKSVILIITCVATLIGCQKQDRILYTENIQSAENNAMMETEFSAMFEAIDDIASIQNDIGNNYKSTTYTVVPSGAMVIFTDSLWNDGDGIEFYIDYGELDLYPPKGILCKDGRYRAGKVYASLSDRYFNLNSILTISVPSENIYYVGNGNDMTNISGTKTVTRIDTNTRNIRVTDAIATNLLGSITWNADRTISKTFNTGPGLWGDEFTITGTSSGTNVNGVGFTANISSLNPLVKRLELGCASTFVSGVITITNNNGDQMQLDYDPYNDQPCDKVARVIINGRSKFIIVR